MAEPIWKMCTRPEAIAVMAGSRTATKRIIEGLDRRQCETQTLLGGGNWSVKDLVGHLASWEEAALRIATGRPQRYAPGTHASADERNAAEIERKRRWSWKRISEEADAVNADLVAAIEAMDDERWRAKVDTGSGRSALGLVLGKTLVGGRFGFFAHDLAHRRDLERSVKALTSG